MAPQLLSSKPQIDAIFTAPPLVSSEEFCWGGTYVDCRWEPPGETPMEVATPWHSIVLFTQLPETALAERWIDSRVKVEPVHPGDILVLPAQVGQRSRWNVPGEFMSLAFEPAALGRSLDAAADGTTVELVPHFATQDLLVLQLGLALKRQLQLGNIDSLYAESLTTTLAVHLLWVGPFVMDMGAQTLFFYTLRDREPIDDFDWAVAWEVEGDCLARYRVRLSEMRESLKIIQQAIDGLPGGRKIWRPNAWPRGQSRSGIASTTSSFPKKLPPPSKSPPGSTTCGWSRAGASWASF